jgi:sodium-dependent dicarboxylate transporter 2/3/5
MGFMLPVGTPPNALAYGTGAVSTGEMARAGVWLDVIGAAVITVAVTLWIG